MRNVTEECGRPVSWIRFNPDNIKGADGRVIKVTLGTRYKTLLKWVAASMERNPTDYGGAVADVVYLYYDDSEPDRVTFISRSIE
jgi:hypothetical protein